MSYNRVFDQVAESPRVLTSSIFLKPNPALALGQPGTRSTCRVRLDFKTMILGLKAN
jgi:hypothetical protein